MKAAASKVAALLRASSSPARLFRPSNLKVSTCCVAGPASVSASALPACLLACLSLSISRCIVYMEASVNSIRSLRAHYTLATGAAIRQRIRPKVRQFARSFAQIRSLSGREALWFDEATLRTQLARIQQLVNSCGCHRLIIWRSELC